MDHRAIEQLFEAKEQRRRMLARMPIEEKIRAVVRLQKMAAPILRQRGKAVRCWEIE